MNLEEHFDYNSGEHAKYSMHFDDGRLADVMPTLIAILAVDPNAEIDSARWDEGSAKIEWKRLRSADEIAQSERDEQERRARSIALGEAEERATFARLKAKFEKD